MIFAENNGLILDLFDCTGLTQLPENLSVNGSLDLTRCTGLTHLPESLSVNGSLRLTSCTGLTQLPETLSVKGDLYLKRCYKITSIPRSITCTGRIDTDLGTFSTIAEAADAFEQRYGTQQAPVTPRHSKSAFRMHA